jgi:hypothetical protein
VLPDYHGGGLGSHLLERVSDDQLPPLLVTDGPKEGTFAATGARRARLTSPQ